MNKNIPVRVHKFFQKNCLCRNCWAENDGILYYSRTVRRTSTHRQEQEQPSPKTLLFCFKKWGHLFGIDLPMFWTHMSQNKTNFTVILYLRYKWRNCSTNSSTENDAATPVVLNGVGYTYKMYSSFNDLEGEILFCTFFSNIDILSLCCLYTPPHNRHKWNNLVEEQPVEPRIRKQLTTFCKNQVQY